MKNKFCCLFLVFSLVLANSCIVFGEPTVPIVPSSISKQILDSNTVSIPANE